jgi:hypothetical protein
MMQRRGGNIQKVTWFIKELSPLFKKISYILNVVERGRTYCVWNDVN